MAEEQSEGRNDDWIEKKLEPLVDPAIRALADRLATVEDEIGYSKEMLERQRTNITENVTKIEIMEDDAKRIRQVIKQLVREREDRENA